MLMIFQTRRLAYPTQFREAKLHFWSKIHPPSPSCGRNLALYFTGRMSEEPNKVKPLSSRSTRWTRRGLETSFSRSDLQLGKWRCFFVFGVMGDAKLIKEARFFKIKDIFSFMVSLYYLYDHPCMASILRVMQSISKYTSPMDVDCFPMWLSAMVWSPNISNPSHKHRRDDRYGLTALINQ